MVLRSGPMPEGSGIRRGMELPNDAPPRPPSGPRDSRGARRRALLSAGRNRRRRVLVLRLRRWSRHWDVAVGRLRARSDGVGPRADPEAFLSGNGGGGLLLGARFDPRRADVGTHD